MSFPIIEGEQEPATRPDNDEVVAAIKRVIGDGMLDSWGMDKQMAAGVSWQQDERKAAKNGR
jgi:hypothetical protein